MDEVVSGRVATPLGSCRSGDAATASSSLRDGDPSRDAIALHLYAVTNRILARQFWSGWTPRPLDEDPAAFEAHYAYADAVLEMMAGAAAGQIWLPISTYPREKVQFGPAPEDTTEWGPEALLLMPPCGQYPHDAVAVTGHLEADMWLSRDAGEPACWGDLAAEPIAWLPLPPASGIAAPEGAEPKGLTEGESPVGGNAETPNPLPQNQHDRSGTGSEVKED